MYTVTEERKLREKAQNFLIRNEKCSTVRTTKYTEIVYGEDYPGLNPDRKWMLEREKACNSTLTLDQMYTAVNKTVLYVDPVEVEQVLKKLFSKPKSKK